MHTSDIRHRYLQMYNTKPYDNAPKASRQRYRNKQMEKISAHVQRRFPEQQKLIQTPKAWKCKWKMMTM